MSIGYSTPEYAPSKKFRLILREQGVMREMGGAETSQTAGIVDSIFTQALDTGTSDIHLQPEREQLKIRYRQDGILVDSGQLPPEMAMNVLARLKLAANMRIDETREPQDGRIDMEYNGRNLSARASCIPCMNGEKFVMRLLDPGSMRVDLQKLGMPEDVLVKWRQAIGVPYGLILVTGPTGSGKTSTLYASLLQLDSGKRNIVTVEDPVEYEFDKNIAQVQVTERMGFPRVMRTFLRQDPDVMMVGEIRDPDSLKIAIQAGLTGHLVLSTLHTNNAVETIQRMEDMGAEPYLIAAVSIAILAQRLVRLNCPKCREPYSPTADEIEAMGYLPEEAERGKFMKGKGCADCRQSGYKGRIGIYEIIVGGPEFREAVAKGDGVRKLHEIARRHGYKTMLEDGRKKAFDGWTTPEEILRAVYTQVSD
jgi:type II secretory ATPase GspE/PulE/Tfp pilus assembly ATPase PilB-like protein